jgi:uncharacterized protein (UPF0210 family)
VLRIALRALSLTLLLAFAARAADDAPPSEAKLPNVRAITAFVRIDRADAARAFADTKRILDEAKAAFERRGYAVQTQRLVTQPVGELVAGLADDDALALLVRLDALAGEQSLALNIGPALLHDGDDTRAMRLLGTTLAKLEHTNASAIIADADGIHWNAIRATAALVHQLGKSEHGQGNFNFAATAMLCPNAPFYPGAYHTGAGQQLAIGLETAGEVQRIFARTHGDFDASVRELSSALTRHARVAQEVGNEVAKAHEWTFVGVDPTPAPLGDVSIGAAIETWTGARFGSSGTMTAALAITTAVKAVKVKRVGYSGLMVPVLEDKRLAERWAQGAYGIDALLAYSSVCGTGLDTVPLPGDVSEDQIARILGDVAALAWKWNKPLTARLLPLEGKKAGERTEFESQYLFNTTLQALPRDR